MILALETATQVCSVAFCNDKGAVFERRTEEHGAHSEQLFLFFEDLQRAQGFSIPELDAVLVSEGPGSYTGLRISASAVKGLLFQTEVPLFAVNTLASFGKQVVETYSAAETIYSIIDARRVHFYYQQFNNMDGTLHAEDKMDLIPIEEFEKNVRRGDVIIGTGLDRISKEVLDRAKLMGPEAITAKSLIEVYQSELPSFFHQTDPKSFDPNYYTSSQIS